MWAGNGLHIRLPDGAKRYEFEKGEFRAEDEYRGFFNSSGRTIIWSHGKPVWQMNYFGSMVSYPEMWDSDEQKLTYAKEVFNFLEEALRNAPKNAPMRGPPRFKSETREEFEVLTYRFRPTGNLSLFNGTETIETWPEIASLCSVPDLPPGTVFVQYIHGGLLIPKTHQD